MKYVIRNDYQETFYAGNKTWSREYSDAHKYNDIGIVMRIVDELSKGRAGIVAIENYGLDTEMQVY